MMDVDFRDSISILLVAVLVVPVDVVVMPILGGFERRVSTAIFLNDFGVVLLAGLAGLFISRRVGCPLWWRRGDGSRASRRVTLITVLLGLVIVVGNTLVYVIQGDQAVQAAPWLAWLTPGMAIAISVRAALTEEVFFRLFLVSLIGWVLWRLTKSRGRSLVVGGLASTLVFGLIHTSFVSAFLVGLAIVYIYYHRGLLPAMITHFLADAIPFVLMSLAYI